MPVYVSAVNGGGGFKNRLIRWAVPEGTQSPPPPPRPAQDTDLGGSAGPAPQPSGPQLWGPRGLSMYTLRLPCFASNTNRGGEGQRKALPGQGSLSHPLGGPGNARHPRPTA